jgi:hypothetical protein
MVRIMPSRLKRSSAQNRTQSNLRRLASSEFFVSHGMASSQPKRLRRLVRGVHELIGRASTLDQRRTARNALIKRLAEESLDWAKDLPGILGAEWLDNNPATRADSASSPSPACDVNLFDLVKTVIEDHVVLSSGAMHSHCAVESQ